MGMNFLHYKLNLPVEPLVKDFVFPQISARYFIYDSDIINPQLVEIFSQHNFNITMAVIFCRPPIQILKNKNSQGVVHSDIMLKNNDWVDIHYGVNFELSDTSSRISWWETNGKKQWPSIPLIETNDDRLRGIHYVKNVHTDLLNYKLIDYVDINEYPVLVNTSIPHSVNYFGQETLRWGLSIRFKQEYSWEQAVDAFKNLIMD